MATVRVFHAVLAKRTFFFTRRYVNRIMTEIETEAVAIAAVGPYTTGKLAKSIYKSTPIVTGKNVSGSIGSRKSYAKIVEDGARIHNIFPRRAARVYRFGRSRRPTLKFEWRGRTVYPNQIPMAASTVGISHPGQKAKHFLLRPLENAAVRHRMQLRVREV